MNTQKRDKTMNEKSILSTEQPTPTGPEPLKEETKMETEKKKTVAPAAALIKRELLSQETQEWLRNILENEIQPLLAKDISAYAPGRMRAWLPFEAPLDSPNSTAKPFVPGILHDELWQFIVDLCAKHGMVAQTALVSKGGNIKPHRDTTFAAPWAMGINLGICNWHIASTRDGAKPDYSMSLSGGEVFSFNSKHVHAVTGAAPDRWAINVWAIADTKAARDAQVHERLAKMLEDNPQVAEFIDFHQPGAGEATPQKEETNMKEFTVVDHSTGEIFEIEANSASTAGQAFLAEGRSVTIKPTTQEVRTMNLEKKEITNPVKEGPNMINEYLVDNNATMSRIITNDPEFAFRSGIVVLDKVDGGGYYWHMLEHMFKNESFAVEITAFLHPFDRMEQDVAVSGKKPADVAFAWADFDAEYLIRIKGFNSGKFENMSKYGLVVGNSAKMTKRLTEIIRAARGGMVNVKGQHKMARILVMTYSDILDCFPHLQTEEIASKTTDGISIITNEYAKKVYRANKHLPAKSRWQTLKAIERGEITNHTLRVVTNIKGKPGMVKGNALSVPADMLLARLRELGMISSTQVVDIVTTVDNFKEELGTNGSWEIITLEPHHGPGMVKTNDQTKAQFWGIKGLFDSTELMEAFQSVLDQSYNNMVEGKDIQWMQNITPERLSTEADKVSAIGGSKVTNNMNRMIASVNELGLDIGVSQTLMFMRAQGILKMFLSENKSKGLNWQASAAEKKSFTFMPWAYRAYVMTKEVIYLAGYDVDMTDNQSFYHEGTQTFCMPGKTWATIQGKLGGADLDDEIMVHERRYIRPDGSVNPLVAFLVRTPNDWAEFAIVNLADHGPAFLTDGDMPTINSADLAKFKQVSKTDTLPSKNQGSTRPTPAVWDWACARYNYKASTFKSGGVGGQVKTKMLHYAINNAPYATLPCANEDMIDALQQCKGSIEDLQLLAEWSAAATADILRSKPMDAYWWYSRNMYRTAIAMKISNPTKHIPAANSPIVQEFAIPREEMVRETHQQMLDFLNRNIREIPELENIFKDKKQEMHYRKLIADLSKLFNMPTMRDEHGNIIRPSKSAVAEHMQNVAVSLLERMANYEVRGGVEQTNLHVLRMVRASYLVKVDRPGANYDRWLYTAANNSEIIMTDYFVRALTWFRNQ